MDQKFTDELVISEAVVLKATKVVKEFRGFRAVDKADLTVPEGEIHALVGPNGAGKTTLFNLLAGNLRPTSGTIEIRGKNVTGKRPNEIVNFGVGRSFQITSLFESESPLWHLQLALQGRERSMGFNFWASERKLNAFRDKSDELLATVGLLTVRDVPVTNLAYGQKRALEIALVLALDAEVILLDEPTAGMGAEDVEWVIELIRSIRENRTIVMVEHNMRIVESLADQVSVLQQGRIIATGTYGEVRANQEVVAAYLGDAHA